MARWFVLVLTACLAALPVGAQSAGGPEAAFEKLFETMRENDWAACSRMMHPEALAEFHQFFTSLARADDSGEVARGFLGLEQGKDAAKLAPATTFQRVMQGMIAMNPGMDEVFGNSRATILGSVPEGDVRHVVYRVRMEIEGAGMSKISVAPFKMHGGEWRALLTGEMEGLIQTLKGRIGDGG